MKHPGRKKHKFWLRAVVVCTWATLFLLLMQRDYFINAITPSEQKAITQANSEQYQSIYFKEKKIGYIATIITPTGQDTLQVWQSGLMHLNVAGATQTIELDLNALVSLENVLRQFSFSFHSPFYQMKATGSRSGSSISYTLQTASSTIRETVKFPAPPLLPTANRAYLLAEHLEIAEKRKIPWFDPVSMTGKNSVVEYRGTDSQLIGGRVQKLHKFYETFSGARVNFWLNDNGNVVKEESPAGFVLIREPKFKALEMDDDGSNELLSAVAIKVTGTLPAPDATVARYQLHFPENAELDLTSDRQTYTDNILTVTREKIPVVPTPPTCAEAKSALSSTAYVQSDAAEIKDLSHSLTSNASYDSDKVKILAAWIYDNLKKQSVIGLPDALTTLKTKTGDCNEHASLFAALARAAGIPTRILSGVTAAGKDAFFYHAWNEVCLGTQWVTVDTTTNQIPVDLTHLQFVRGELAQQIRLSALLGNLTIEPISQNAAASNNLQ